jgi:hypothetical protein
MADVDPVELRARLSVAALLGGLWLFLLGVPLAVAGVLFMPPVPVWGVFGALFVYSLYTGIRAWRRGWKSRFILRVVVPIALLALSTICASAWLWIST